MKRTTKSLTAAALLALGAGGCGGALSSPLASPAEGGPTWRELVSEHIVLHTDASADGAPVPVRAFTTRLVWSSENKDGVFVSLVPLAQAPSVAALLEMDNAAFHHGWGTGDADRRAAIANETAAWNLVHMFMHEPAWS